MVVLDTNMMSVLKWRDTPKANTILDRLDRYPAKEIATTIITYEEQVRGWLSFIHQHQDKQHRRFPTMDLKIAAIVKTKSATLVSENLRHFTPIAGLTVENWL